MAISLFGIIIVQVLWIRHAIKSEEAQFDKSVYSALNAGIAQLEKRKMFRFMDTKMNLPAPSPVHFDSLIMLYEPDSIDIDFVKFDSSLIGLRKGKRNIIVFDSGENRQVIRVVSSGSEQIIEWNIEQDIEVDLRYEVFDEENNTEYEELIEMEEFEALQELEELKDFNRHVIVRQRWDSVNKVFKVRQEIRAVKERMVHDKMKAFNRNMEQWVFEYSFDEDRLRSRGIYNNIDTVIKCALKNNGVDLEFVSQIIKDSDDTTIIIRSVGDDGELLSNYYKTELFPNDFFRNDIFFMIDFPGRSKHIYRSVFLLAFGSLTFTIIILLTFGLTLYYINKQKKISEVKSDFINNMTHEFKTPIATISLATDTMSSPKIIGNAEQTKYYLDIIRQENKRMNNQVEKVLQMALIENHDIQLDFQKTDIHSIIENTVHVAELTAKKQKGRIVNLFRASCSEVPVDEIHFANILNNLLDNAMKYTEKPPEILVETYNKDQQVFVRVSDNGIGMSKEVQKNIFDKFYRKQSGNIHNVKGFGLGLSYVKAIVDAHGGTISVSSEPGNGSVFTLSFVC